MSTEHFSIRFFTPEDVEEVARLFSDTFCGREPITKYLKTSRDSFYVNFTKPISLDCAKEQLSLVCEDQSLPKGERIIGFRLSETVNFNYDCEPEENCAIKALLNYMKAEWTKRHPEFDANEQKIMNFVALGVKDGFEGFGIASKLVKASLDNAKKSGYQMAVVIATAQGTQHIFSNKYKFKEVYALAYDEFEFKHQKPYYGLKLPPTAKIFELDLTSWNIGEN
ncbi:hypothetical protein B4U79_16224 [Dinothrombium tinctorium]|uniref:N-acetyltransferase domain-containing protein n=1 Tax=Dinothrombium tinctorium TaxID=1965070 RepID=A0A443QTJ7_9ACAR|nr:hypothetical protein B4U79_16224 [Dinothrombium tinctorium]